MNKWLNLLKKKESLFILILTGLILLVIAIPTKSNDITTSDSEATAQTQDVQVSKEDYCDTLEERLEKILSCIKGVGKVEVMITLKDTGENVVEKDTSGQEISENGEESSTWEEETVYGKNNDSTYPYVVNTYQPQIQGVLVVAQGVDDPVIQKEIMEGVMALFGIESHKISIINME